MKKQKGFTLIELLVVISIIGVLSAVVLSALNSARAKARDAQRMAALHSIQIALEMYYDVHGTYLVAGTGWNDGGNGFLSYTGGVPGNIYNKEVTRQLYEEKFLATPVVKDPYTFDFGYMIYICEGGEVYSLSASKENPTPADIANIQKTCNGSGINGTYSTYGKNYAVWNKLY